MSQSLITLGIIIGFAGLCGQAMTLNHTGPLRGARFYGSTAVAALGAILLLAGAVFAQRGL